MRRHTPSREGRGVWATLAVLTLLAACSTTPPKSTATPPAATGPATAREAGVVRAASPVGTAAVAPTSPAAALAAFRRSCPALLKRTDVSGLTQPGDWAAACAAAATAPDARSFFASQFVAVRIGDGAGLNTGYFEPELAASLTRAPGYAVPLYRRPPDLIEADLGAFADSLKGRKVRGRVAGTAFVPYFDRAEIDAGALAGRGLELAWAADPYDAFFLEIQGSGRLRLPDGSIVGIGYDGQNGRDYTAIGKVLRERNALPSGGATMDGIIAWMKAQPDGGAALMHENRSKIFFRKLPGGDPGLGPPGALNIPLTPGTSVAADPKFVPLGAPLWLDRGGAVTLMVAQDTGGAIRGPNRLDLFQGTGEVARKTAGGLASQGRVVLLLPPTSVARLGLR
ncbi:murein transglycosylase A [Sphingosinicellaceae bacterium]|nr:murein transglycosylase A [Sphingosinicellaceae bacterium]